MNEFNIKAHVCKSAFHINSIIKNINNKYTCEFICSYLMYAHI